MNACAKQQKQNVHTLRFIAAQDVNKPLNIPLQIFWCRMQNYILDSLAGLGQKQRTQNI